MRTCCHRWQVDRDITYWYTGEPGYVQHCPECHCIRHVAAFHDAALVDILVTAKQEAKRKHTKKEESCLRKRSRTWAAN